MTKMVEENKLRRYRGKDYSETVEFPVELVDRDGVVRRYSYRESLRVYLRRIASAHVRYSDENLVLAEVDHCNKRIDQLRRSYLHRCRDLGARLASDRRTRVQFVLGEGLAVLHEELGEPLFESAQLDIVALAEDEIPAVYQVTRSETGQAYLLYVFEGDKAETPYETHRRSLEWNELSGTAIDERLVVAREGETAAFLLTQRVTHEPAPLSDGLFDLWSERHQASADPDPDEYPGAEQFALGLAALKQRNPAEAIRYFKEAIDDNPYHREAYLALSTLLDTVGSVDEGEMYSSLAVAYLPGDGLVHFNRGLSLMRQGRKDEACEVFERAADLDQRLYQPRYFVGLLLAMKGRLSQARRAFQDALVHAGHERGRVEVALRWVEHRQRIQRWSVAGVAATLTVAVIIALWSPLLALPFAGVALLIAAAYPIQTRLARRWFTRYSLTPGPSQGRDPEIS